MLNDSSMLWYTPLSMNSLHKLCLHVTSNAQSPSAQHRGRHPQGGIHETSKACPCREARRRRIQCKEKSRIISSPASVASRAAVDAETVKGMVRIGMPTRSSMGELHGPTWARSCHLMHR